MIYLVRHAKAGHRGENLVLDRHRHLTSSGRGQAKEIAGYFAAHPVERILSSPYTRCLETVAPTAAELGLEVEASEALAEETTLCRLQVLLEELVAQGAPVALCSHGNVIPVALDLMGKSSPEALACAKGSVTRFDTGSRRIEYIGFTG